MASGHPDPDAALTARAATDRDLEAIRAIRNAGARWMTGDSSQIGPEEQRSWFAGLPEDWRLTVYEWAGRVVAYGLVRPETPEAGARTVGSVAVAPDARGHGIGRRVLRDMRRSGRGTIWLLVRPANVACLATALAAGYAITAAQGRMVTLAGAPEGSTDP